MADAVGTNGELTINIEFNIGDEDPTTLYNFFPLFTAYEKAPAENDNHVLTNTWSMLAIQTRGVQQVNDAGWTNFTNEENVKGINTESSDYLKDGKWHTVTVTYTKEESVFYVDGNIMNKWKINTANGGVNGFLSQEGAGNLKYIWEAIRLGIGQMTIRHLCLIMSISMTRRCHRIRSLKLSVQPQPVRK